jgi:ADP-ribosylglycohydrolase
MDRNARAMVVASFAADSLALGAHWIYDTHEIEGRFGRVQNLRKPEEDSYHPTKDRGEFTHYGDQTLVLLESVAQCSGFDLEQFARHWRAHFEGYHGYFDKATKGTLKNLSEGARPTASGSASTDLAGAARIAPLVYRYRNSPQELVIHARAQTAMTHNNPMVVGAADFFARVTYRVLTGNDPQTAMMETTQESFAGTPIEEWVRSGMQSVAGDSRETIVGFGQSCDTRGAFPAVVHLIAKHQGNLEEALTQNVMAGGDSAARGMVAGMVLGAHLGPDAIPGTWLAALKHREQIVALLDNIDRKTQ